VSTQFYNQHADKLAQQYLSKGFEQLHHSWLHLLDPILAKSNATILDVGAGSGRDSRYLADIGAPYHTQVTAVEPAQVLATIGKEQTKAHSVAWVDDSLPSLSKVMASEERFDLILLSAVWMHIPASQRQESLNTLTKLLNPNGKIVISLRHGPSGDERIMYPVSVNELVGLAYSDSLMPSLVTKLDSDKLGRKEVSWQTVVLTPKGRI